MKRQRRLGLAIAVAFFISGCTTTQATQTPAPSTPAGGATPAAEESAASPGPVVSSGPGATPQAAQWVSAGTMNLARSLPHAILLSTGEVLVVGEDAACEGEGLYGGTKSVYAELYHPSTNSWTNTGSLNAPRAYFASAALPNGRALVTGGVNGDGVSYSSTKIYDVSTGAFTQPGLLNYARTFPLYATLKDGRVLVAGGTYYASPDVDGVPRSSAEIFDPATQTWAMTGAMHEARDDTAAVTLADGRVLVVGGGSSSSVASAELWNPATGTWANAGSLATWRFDFSLVALPDGSALVAGGWDAGPIASAERFDPATLSWSSAGNMHSAAAERLAVLLANGKVLLAGGRGGNGDIAAAEIYDPATGSWTPTVPLPHMRADGQAVLLADGSVLIAGGDDGPSNNGATGGGDCRRALPEALRYLPGNP
jgi:hypothetical protein